MESHQTRFSRRRKAARRARAISLRAAVVISSVILVIALVAELISLLSGDRSLERRFRDEPEIVIIGDDWEQVRIEHAAVWDEPGEKIELRLVENLEAGLEDVVVVEPGRITPAAEPLADALRPRAPAPPLSEDTVQEVRELEHSPVLISEIHYNPKKKSAGPQKNSEGPAKGSTEFVELFNRSDAVQDLSLWKLAGGIAFSVPDGTRLGAGEFLVVCGDRETFVKEHGELDSSRVLGDFQGKLSNRGETLVLLTADDEVADRVRYEDRLPFDVHADGHGPSLERRCFETASSSSDNWRASKEPGGSPLAKNRTSACPPAPRPPSSSVVINEIHYHPFDDARERLEFIELHNRSEVEVDLHGWTLRDAVRYAFDREKGPAKIAPGGFLVVARYPEEIRRYAELSKDSVAGPYEGKLSNRAERVVLADADGLEVEAVPYRQDGEWPARADGLGSSLQRVSPDVAAHVPWNWKVYDIYKTFVTGLDGTPMPSYQESLNKQQRWDIVSCCLELMKGSPETAQK